MQRIDENTYIDDTLVTCAEYQLFIDEMRKQGLYYQPDHWALFKFPAGQAHEPILGVRHSGAVAFCEWYTHESNDGWLYRLPTQMEMDNSLIKPFNSPPLGCWLNTTFQFSWIGTFPTNPRKLKIDLSHNGKRTTCDLNKIIGINSGFDVERSPYLYRIFDRSYSFVDRRRKIEELIGDKTKILLENNELIYVIHEDPAELEKISIFIDLLTLRERIAGHSPAFEGIRIVKERIT